jgi:hypothetical protein
MNEPITQLKVKYRLIEDGTVVQDQHMMLIPRQRYQTDYYVALETLARMFGDAGYTMDSVEVVTQESGE